MPQKPGEPVPLFEGQPTIGFLIVHGGTVALGQPQPPPDPRSGQAATGSGPSSTSRASALAGDAALDPEPPPPSDRGSIQRDIRQVDGAAVIGGAVAVGNDQGPVRGVVLAELGLRRASRSLASGGHRRFRTADICFVSFPEASL